jgi:hypothetical protein
MPIKKCRKKKKELQIPVVCFQAFQAQAQKHLVEFFSGLNDLQGILRIPEVTVVTGISVTKPGKPAVCACHPDATPSSLPELTHQPASTRRKTWPLCALLPQGLRRVFMSVEKAKRQ